MIATSEAFAQKSAERSRRFRARMLCGGEELEGALRSLTVYSGSCGENTFAPGTVYSSRVEAVVQGTPAALEGREIELRLGLLTGEETWEEITLGFFTVEKPTAAGVETSFTAYGRIAARFGGSFVQPAERTLTAILAALSHQTGTEILLSGLTAAGSLEKSLSGMTCRQALQAVAGVLGGYATETPEGRVVIAAFSSAVTAETDVSRMTQPPSFEESDLLIRGVEITAAPETVDADGNVTPAQVFTAGDPTLSVENEYMTEALFPACAENLIGLRYRPGRAVLALGEARLTPGDTLLVRAGEAEYVLPCMAVVQHFDGGLWTEVSAPGMESGGTLLGATGIAVRDLRTAMLQVQRLFADYARVDLLNVEEIRDDSGENYWNLRTGELCLGGYLIRGSVEYALGTSPLEPPESGWSESSPVWETGLYVWQRTVLEEADGTTHVSAPVCIQGAAGEKGRDGEDATVLRIDSSKGTLFKHSNFDTVLTVTVLRGSERITNAAALRAAYGAAAHLTWKWRRTEDESFHPILSDDTHISQEGFAFTVTPDDVDEKIIFQCDLEV